MSKTDGEEISVLKVQMGRVEKDIAEIKGDIKTILLVLPTQATLKAEIEGLKEELKEIRKTNNMWKWLSPSIAAVLGSVLTFLLIEYITSLR